MKTVEGRKFTFNDVLFNLFSCDKAFIKDYLDALNNNNVSGDKILYPKEETALSVFDTIYRETGEVPTLDLFMSYYPDYEMDSTFETKDLLGVIRLFIKQRKNENAANKLANISNRVRLSGVTSEISDEVTDILQQDVSETKYENILDKILDNYDRSVDNSGIKTGIGPIDEAIGGLKAGQVSVVSGFTGMGKSICSVSIMHSAMEQGYNVCYISLELSKDHLTYNLISRHSLCNKFSKKIEHRALKSKTLSRTERDYVETDILPDIKAMPGKCYILDEQDIEAYNYFAFDNKLREIDNLCISETGKGIDLIIVDHVQMLAFSNQGSNLSENTVINRWCNYFRSQCLDFLKSKRQIHVILVAQINRQGYLKAVKHQGMYDMTALKEANELETCASVILGIFSDPSLITSNQAKVGVLKNRDGERSSDAYQVSANFPYQLIGGDGPTVSSVMASADIDSFNDMMNDVSSMANEIGFVDTDSSEIDFSNEGLGIHFEG